METGWCLEEPRIRVGREGGRQGGRQGGRLIVYSTLKRNEDGVGRVMRVDAGGGMISEQAGCPWHNASVD